MISKKTRYALLALVRLAKEYGKEPILISDIAESEHLPQRFLEGILLEMKKNGFLKSKLGKKGGYQLARHPSEIHIVDLYRLFEGPISLLPCASVKYYEACEFCKDEPSCKIRMVFRDIRDYTVQKLSNTSLLDLM